MRSLVLTLIGLLGIGLLHSVVSAQSSEVQPITYGDTISGEISEDEYRFLYTFSGRGGEVIAINMAIVSGDLDPYLVLLDQDGTVISYSDDEGAGAAALIDSQRLPYPGNYFIVATRFGQEHGSTTGEYELSIMRLGIRISPGDTIQYGDEFTGEIGAEQPHAIYYFDGRRGEAVTIHMQRTSGNLDPLLILANEAGQVLVEQDDDPTATGTLTAKIIRYVLPNSGTYIILATRYGREAGDTSGRFLLSLDVIPESERGLSFGDAIIMIYGEVVTNSIDVNVPQRYYSFPGARGEVVTVIMERTSGNLDSLVILLDSQRRELGRSHEDDPPNRAQIMHLSLPADGDYFIMATREGFSQGTTEGVFELSLDGRMGIAGAEQLEIFYDSGLEGTINDTRPLERYVFLGESGDIVSISMTRISGNLDPLITLYFDNKQIAFDDDSGEGQDALLARFQLAEDGIYSLEASRFDRFAGNTSGDYFLYLESH